ncbi:MAG: glutamate decarboxylase 1 [Lasallia pustulata]|uniref:Glutamate decarboxylase 1 n=1 Tax=Lasallia pustulata TaxID=136370 RepID=A0A5M8PH50_9LECA|nr:MAG: glutamate decarboxylase 1 [Lasallia pustulata]
MSTNAASLPDRSSDEQPVLHRADDVSALLEAVQSLLIPFIRAADEDAATKGTGHGLQVNGGGPRTALVEHHKPAKLTQLLDFQLPDAGKGREGLLASLEKILHYSVNTWDQGFLDKLYASTDAVGVASELILAVLNTNVHVYQVSPALTIIEKTTTRALANLFGLTGAHAGGISVQGGSASNTTSIVIARNTLYPDTKTQGNSAGGRKLILFTSAHGHYSIEKAAQMLGFGSSAVWSIPVDSSGRMIPSELESQILLARSSGHTPFFVNATAGTTVLGSYDPIPPLSALCTAHHLWLHLDASWGGPAIFSLTHAPKLTGSHLANSIAINPHKMLGVPLTCSFLLAADLRQFHAANTLPASYLFHPDPTPAPRRHLRPRRPDPPMRPPRRQPQTRPRLDLPRQGRLRRHVDAAFATAAYLSAQIAARYPHDLKLVSADPPPCLQVCFYYAPGGRLCPEAGGNSKATEGIAKELVARGFMVDYAEGERGRFFRVVVNRETRRGTVDGLLRAVVEAGRKGLERVHPGVGVRVRGGVK